MGGSTRQHLAIFIMVCYSMQYYDACKLKVYRGETRTISCSTEISLEGTIHIKSAFIGNTLSAASNRTSKVRQYCREKPTCLINTKNHLDYYSDEDNVLNIKYKCIFDGIDTLVECDGKLSCAKNTGLVVIHSTLQDKHPLPKDISCEDNSYAVTQRLQEKCSLKEKCQIDPEWICQDISNYYIHIDYICAKKNSIIEAMANKSPKEKYIDEDTVALISTPNYPKQRNPKPWKLTLRGRSHKSGDGQWLIHILDLDILTCLCINKNIIEIRPQSGEPVCSSDCSVFHEIIHVTGNDLTIMGMEVQSPSGEKRTTAWRGGLFHIRFERIIKDEGKDPSDISVTGVAVGVSLSIICSVILCAFLILIHRRRCTSPKEECTEINHNDTNGMGCIDREYTTLNFSHENSVYCDLEKDAKAIKGADRLENAQDQPDGLPVQDKGTTENVENDLYETENNMYDNAKNNNDETETTENELYEEFTDETEIKENELYEGIPEKTEIKENELYTSFDDEIEITMNEAYKGIGEQ